MISSGASGGLGYPIFTVPAGEELIGADGRINPNATLGRVFNYKGKDYMIKPDNWENLGFRNGLRKEYDISLTGGSDKMQYYLSLGYLNNEVLLITLISIVLQYVLRLIMRLWIG